jgi:hypothetical protein
MHFSCFSEHVYMHKTRSVALSLRLIFIIKFACSLLASLKEKRRDTNQVCLLYLAWDAYSFFALSQKNIKLKQTI